MIKPLLPEKTQHKAEFIDSRQTGKNLDMFEARFGPYLARLLLQFIQEDA